MICPHNDRQQELCDVCGRLFCTEECLGAHVCGEDEMQFSEDDDVADSIEEDDDVQPEFDFVEGSEMLSLPMAMQEMEQSEQLVDDMVDDMPHTDLSMIGSGEQLAPPNGMITLARPKPSPKAYRFRALLWNVANLGGKFGYPIERDQSVIDAIAAIIHAADPDVVAILEVLQKGSERPPKAPIELRDARARAAAYPVIDSLHKATGCAIEDTKEIGYVPDPAIAKRAGEVDDAVGRWFAARVMAAIWPGAVVDMTELEAAVQAIAFKETTLDLALNAAWPQIAADVAALAPPPPSEETEEGKEADGGVEAKPTGANLLSRYLKRGRGGADRKRLLLPEVIALLADEGYTHFLDKYASNYADDPEDETLTPEEMAARDKLCDAGLEDLQRVIGDIVLKFLQALTGCVAEDDRNGCFRIIVKGNYDARHADYERRLAEYNEGREKRKAGSSHDGVRELLRIRAALNALAGGAYASSPPAEPEPESPSIYTHGETYGILWKKAVFSVDPAQCGWVSKAAKNVAFAKREPIRVPLRLNAREDAPPLYLVAWHPPAPSTTNRAARANDFPAFISYCEQERAAPRLGMLLSDLNVNTLTMNETIEHCTQSIGIAELFRGICGMRFDGAALQSQFDAHSTVGVSRLRSWLMDCRVDDPMRQKLAWLQKELEKQRKDSSQRVFENINQFLTHPQYRYGASAYDKIVTISTVSMPWLLRQKTTYVVPVPHAVAMKEEAGLLREESSLSRMIKPFAFRLLQDGILAPLRKHAKKEEPVASVRELMLVARKLSDHMPLVAHFELLDGATRGDDEVEEIDVAELMSADRLVPGSSKPPSTSALDRLEQLAKAYEGTEKGEPRSAALDEMVGWFNTTWPDGSAPPKAVLRLQRAMQTVEISDQRDAEKDESDRSSRPKLGKSAQRAQVAQEALNVMRANFVAVPNGGGGDCLFRSIAHLVFGDQNLHAEVRQAVVNHLEDLLAVNDPMQWIGQESSEEFATAMRHLLDWHRVQWPHVAAYRRVFGADPWQQYLIAMAHGEWGDLIALSAASNLFGVRFVVYVSGVNTFWSDDVNIVDLGNEEPPVRYLLNHGNYHFEALAPRDDAFELDAIALQQHWEEIREVRDRVKDDGVMEDKAEQPQEVVAMQTSTTTSSSSAKGTKPAIDSAVVLWPANVFWSMKDTIDNPRALFLFGENDADRHSGRDQKTTQACIRRARNAVGIRTCWKPGASESENGAMLDAELDTRNKAAIDEDLNEAYDLLCRGYFTTLVVPWATAETALGVGVAQLPTRAPQTYAYLCKRVNDLMAWAQAKLRNVLVLERQTGVTPAVCGSHPSSLFVVETTASLRGTALGLELCTNVLTVATGFDLFAPKRIGDDHLDDSKTLIDEDIGAIAAAITALKYRRFVLPVGIMELGSWLPHDSETFKHLQQRLGELRQLCETTDVAALAVPEYDVWLVTSSDDSSSGGGEEEEDAGEEGAQERPLKRVRTQEGGNDGAEDVEVEM